MSYKIDFIIERRLSLKILGQRVRKYCKFCYSILLHCRYKFFRKSCFNRSKPNISYSDGSWVNRKTTKDLLKIITHLEKYDDGFSILQIGVGNSELFRVIGKKSEKFIGITVIDSEVEYAKKKFPDDCDARYLVFLMNKYSKDVIALGYKFDLIVDNDLSSYACCKYHFEEMLDSYHNILNPSGKVFVGIDGLGYFDTGFGLTSAMARKLVRNHGFNFVEGKDFHMLQRLE